MHTFDSDHHIDIHTLHQTIDSMDSLSHEQKAYLRGQFDAHNHGGLVSGHGINEVMHQISNASSPMIHGDHLHSFGEALQQHFTPHSSAAHG